MKRIAFLFMCGALAASAQEIRISHAAMLRSERSMISLRAGTIVDVQSRDQWTLTVRFNRYTGIIPASCLPPGDSLPQAESYFGSSATRTESPFGRGVKVSEANQGQNNPKRGDMLLAVN